MDYRLDFIIEEGSYFIVSPKDVIKAVPRSFDDHIRWLMENYEFEQALDEINKAPTNTAKIYTHQVNLFTRFCSSFFKGKYFNYN